MVEMNFLALAGLGVSLGLRHGIDWDHIAAITDITSSSVTTTEVEVGKPARQPVAERMRLGAGGGGLAGRCLVNEPALAVATPAVAVAAMAPTNARRRELWAGFSLATLYALGHASVVVMLGLLAIWASEILPAWIDPVMERIVGATLLLLGGWIIYSLVRYGKEFRLQSRWMVVFSLIRRGWARAKSKVTGQRVEHRHDFAQYGPKTAFGIGMIHGIGAETGSQALLLASAAGATTRATGSLLLAFFTLGLLASNSLIAALSTFGFTSSSARRNVYLVIGVFAAIFSITVGLFFITGRGSALPDLQTALGGLFGTAGARR